MSNVINILTAIYSMFNITDNVNAYTDILNIAAYLIFIRAKYVVINPNTLKNIAFEIIVKKYITNAYIKIVKNTLTYKVIILPLLT